MMTRKAQRAKGLNNIKCFTEGHEWRSTAANNFRICAREDCRATERLDEETGAWIDVTATDAQLKKHRPVVPTRPTPTLLWDERLLLTLGLHPRQREMEDHAERRYLSQRQTR